MKFVNRRSKQNTEISMLNLIDVIFMLLIFFMIATTFNKYSQFQLSIPKSDAKFDKKEETRVEIVVDRNRNYYIKIGDNVKQISLEGIPAELDKFPKELLGNITVTADEHLEYGTIVETMAKLKNNNIKNINLNIQKNNK